MKKEIMMDRARTAFVWGIKVSLTLKNGIKIYSSKLIDYDEQTILSGNYQLLWDNIHEIHYGY